MLPTKVRRDMNLATAAETHAAGEADIVGQTEFDAVGFNPFENDVIDAVGSRTHPRSNRTNRIVYGI